VEHVVEPAALRTKSMGNFRGSPLEKEPSDGVPVWWVVNLSTLLGSCAEKVVKLDWDRS
jgi:hypothetical protein